MTSTIEETVADPLAGLALHKVGETLAQRVDLPPDMEVHYLPIPEFLGAQDGVILLPPDADNHGNMWPVNRERLAQSRALQPWMNYFGWWVEEADLGPLVTDPDPDAVDASVEGLTRFLPKYRVRQRINSYLVPDRIVAVIERESAPFHRVGIALAPPGAGRTAGNMWPIDSVRLDAEPDLAPFRGWYGLWVSDVQVQRESAPTNEAGADLSDVPFEYRAGVPAGARWGRLTAPHDRMPEGRYLIYEHPTSGGGENVLLALWPGHSRWSHGGPRGGIPDDWRGWWVPPRLIEYETPEPTPEDRLDIPAQYLLLMPDTVRLVRLHNPDVGAHPPGLYAARNVDGRWHLISWPGMEAHSERASRRDWLPTPLRAYRLGNQRTVDDLGPLPTPPREDPVREEAETVETLRARLAEVEAAYAQDLATIGRMMGEEAQRRDWCEDYERIMNRINENLSGDMPITRPPVSVLVDFSGSVVSTFTGSVRMEVPYGYSSDEVREAARAAIRERGLSEMPTDLTPTWGDVDIDGVSIDNWEDD